MTNPRNRKLALIAKLCGSFHTANLILEALENLEIEEQNRYEEANRETSVGEIQTPF